MRKLESGNIEASFIQGNVVAHLQYIIESFYSLAEDKSVELKFEPKEEVVLDYDPDKLLHIISNLLVNAVKFTPDGGTVSISLEIHKDTDAPYY